MNRQNVKTGVLSMLVMGCVLVFQPTARSQAYCAGNGQSDVCSSAADAKCGNARESSKRAFGEKCETGAPVSGKAACKCESLKRDVRPVPSHSLALRAKGGGAGAVAVATFLGLVGFWSLWGAWKARETARA
jgi:hypothetical protein